MKMIKDSVIRDEVELIRFLAFRDSLTEKERDVFNIALTFGSAKLTNNNLKVGVEVSPYLMEELERFKPLAEKHGFVWLQDISEQEKQDARKSLLDSGDYFEFVDGNGDYINDIRGVIS
jgi:hypothetical protein